MKVPAAPRFLKCEDMNGAPIMVTVAQIVGITNRLYVGNPLAARRPQNFTEDELYVTTIHTTGRVFENINASMEQIETALSGDGQVRFE